MRHQGFASSMGLGFTFTLLLGCQSAPLPSDQARTPSSEELATIASDTAELRYFTFNSKNLPQEPTVETFGEERWKNIQPGGRTTYLAKFYYATTRAKSNRGLGHAACFLGNGADVQKKFFGADLKFDRIKGGVPATRVSSDGMMMGIRYVVDGGDTIFFRLSHCHSGKSPIGSQALKSVETAPEKETLRSIPNLKNVRAPASQKAEDGFAIEDEPQNTAAAQGLPRFHLKTDFDHIKPNKNDRPWKGMDISTPQGAFAFAVLLQKYVYDGMFEGGDKNPDNNLIAQNNKEREWCHMPWLQAGDSGREWVHGLTKERDLYPSPTMEVYKAATKGSDWGVAYFNSYACATLAKVFGSERMPNSVLKIDESNSASQDGSLVAKFLFTTANWPAVKSAFKWTANLSGPGNTARELGDARHIQMDIAVRDSSLKGTLSELNHWVMVTYYFDPDYDYAAEYESTVGGKSPLDKVANLPKGFFKMRPQGVQLSFDAPASAQGSEARFAEFTGASIIFKRAQTNEPAGRLNGPADNPKSSCLGCHGAAGTKISMVPGVQTLQQWKSRTEHGLDFSQQLSLARRNIETYLQ